MINKTNVLKRILKDILIRQTLCHWQLPSTIKHCTRQVKWTSEVVWKLKMCRSSQGSCSLQTNHYRPSVIVARELCLEATLTSTRNLMGHHGQLHSPINDTWMLSKAMSIFCSIIRNLFKRSSTFVNAKYWLISNFINNGGVREQLAIKISIKSFRSNGTRKANKDLHMTLHLNTMKRAFPVASRESRPDPCEIRNLHNF